MTSTLITTLLLAAIYLVIVRFVDMNEKEPLWAMLLVFALGAGSGIAVTMIASQSLIGLNAWTSASIKELVKFLAIGAGVGVLILYGQRRGWEEFNGTMDGIVYGTCAGLGFGVGEQLVHELTYVSVSIPGLKVGAFTGFGKLALSGLSDGIVGAVIGAGYGAASETRSPIMRAIWPIASLLLAVVADAAYTIVRFGNSLGDSGALRANAALFTPLIFLIGVAVFALAQERRAIRNNLDDEVATGAVGTDDLALLKNVMARHLAYTKAFLTGKLRLYFGLRHVHNLQVQLAFAKARLASESDPARRARVESEVHKIRTTLVDQRRALGLAGSGT
jgi:RsiW-degrading membrane proteinase PrsW (M82 family)